MVMICRRMHFCDTAFEHVGDAKQGIGSWRNTF